MNRAAPDVMLDMETLGLGPRAVVINLALVAFDEQGDGLGPYLFRVLDRQQQQELGRDTDASTVQWWASQPAEARAQLDVPGEGLSSVLTAVRYFLEDSTVGLARVRLWSCGADFDLALLQSLHRDAGLTPPWDFRQQRCYRTLKELQPREYKAACTAYPRMNKHDALADAMWQARIAQFILRTRPQ